MKQKDIVRKYTFTKEERDALSDLQIGMIAAKAQLDGMNMYKNVALMGVYKRLGIDGEPRKGYQKFIDYNLGANEIIYTEHPIPEEVDNLVETNNPKKPFARADKNGNPQKG